MSYRDVVCDDTSIEEIEQFFRFTHLPGLMSIKLVLQSFKSSETFIPADVLRNKRTKSISITCPVRSFRYSSLQVDRNAFRSNRNYTEHVELDGMECAMLDLSFLTGFNQLTHLSFFDIPNIELCLPSLPFLPSLLKLSIGNCIGMSELNSYPYMTNGLKEVKFIGSFYDHQIDESVDRLMDFLLFFSANTLEEMTMSDIVRMTEVPKKISSFKALRELTLDDDSISTIKSGAFSFSTAVSLLKIQGNIIKNIEPCAFQGIHIL